MEETKKRISKPRNKSAVKIKLLVGVVAAEDAEKVSGICNETSATLSYAFEAFGTARTAVLDYLGLGETEKRMVLGLIPDVAEAAILENIQRETELYLVGKGICFTVPLSGVSSIVAKGLVKGASGITTGKEKKMDKKEHKTKREYELIIAAMQSGFAEDAMTAAREAGAAGGTLVHAVTLDNRKAEQLIGVTIQRETEILMILTKSEGKLAIMRAIQETAGLKTDGGGILFSVPVDNLIGIAR